MSASVLPGQEDRGKRRVLRIVVDGAIGFKRFSGVLRQVELGEVVDVQAAIHVATKLLTPCRFRLGIVWGVISVEVVWVG